MIYHHLRIDASGLTGKLLQKAVELNDRIDAMEDDFVPEDAGGCNFDPATVNASEITELRNQISQAHINHLHAKVATVGEREAINGELISAATKVEAEAEKEFHAKRREHHDASFGGDRITVGRLAQDRDVLEHRHRHSKSVRLKLDGIPDVAERIRNALLNEVEDVVREYIGLPAIDRRRPRQSVFDARDTERRSQELAASAH